MSKESDSYITMMGQKAATYLGYEIRPDPAFPVEWVPKVAGKSKKGELYPAIVVWPNGIEIRWKTGSVVWYIDFFRCNRVQNQSFDNCADILCSIRGEPPDDQVIQICKDQWRSEELMSAYRNQRLFLLTFPEYKVSLLRETAKKIHASQVEI